MQSNELKRLYALRAMNLIDFRHDTELNALREAIGAPLIEWDESAWTNLDKNELLRRLNSFEGIEVALDEVVFKPDGTFEYKGQKVLVYIRDQYQNSRYANNEYKFHIANCRTIQQSFDNQRSDRYVVSTRIDGKFLVNIRNLYGNDSEKKTEIRELHVCKNCLLQLRYGGYKDHSRGKSIYANFKLEKFFEKYGGTRFVRKPRHTDITAPPDEYSKDFALISYTLRESNNWRCQECGRDLSGHKELLHTHHVNGNKSDNSAENLIALCIRCHANQPMHGQLGGHPDLRKFHAIFGT